MELKFIREDTDTEDSELLEVEDGIKVKELLQQQNVPVEEVIVAVDGTIVSKNKILENVETVRVMQVVAGG